MPFFLANFRVFGYVNASSLSHQFMIMDWQVRGNLVLIYNLVNRQAQLSSVRLPIYHIGTLEAMLQAVERQRKT